MWRADVPACLVIGRTRVELGSPGGVEHADGPVTAELGPPVDDDAGKLAWQVSLHQALQSLVRSAVAQRGDRLRGRALRVVVSDAWLCTAMLPWSTALTSKATASAYAMDQMRAAGFEVSADDRVMIEDAPFRAMRLAVAYPAALMSAVQDAARQMDMVLEIVVALSMVATALAQRAAGRAAGVLALIDGRAVRFYQWGKASFVPLGQDTNLPDGTDLGAELQRLWRRHQLRSFSSTMTASIVTVVDLDAGSPGVTQALAAGFQFLALPADELRLAESPLMRLARSSDVLVPTLGAAMGKGAVSRLGVGALLAAALLASVVVYMASRDAAEVRRQEAALAALSPPVAEPKRAAPSKDAMARIVSINTAITALNTPIGPLLKALQPPPDIRVGLLALEILPPKVAGEAVSADAMVKLSAEAASESEMARYVTFVGSRPPFTAAYLTHHESHESDPSRPYRFSVEAQWQP